MSIRVLLGLLISFVMVADGAGAQNRQLVSVANLRSRQDRAMQAASDAIVLVRSRSSLLADSEHGFRQDPVFFYFTGLGNAVGALLAMDSRRHETWLFLPDAGQLPGFGALLRAPYGYVEAGSASAARLGLDHVALWSDFESFIHRRVAEDPSLMIRGPFRPERATAVQAELVGQDETRLWEHALRVRWPHLRLGPAPDWNALRAIKDQDEIAALRRVAESSAAALLAGLAGLRPWRRQRDAEVDVVAACVRAGADRVSFWPWIMSGVNSDVVVAFQSLADDRYLDRAMRAGELVRVDVGCAQEHYEGDVGRTAPVTGRFDPGQREAWDIFVGAYRVGLEAIRPGRTAKDVFAAWQGEFDRRRSDLRTDFGKRTAAGAVQPEASKYWELHGVGLASAEGRIDMLAAGQVLAFEPTLSIDGAGLYLEDMILVTDRGVEILTKGLPYMADEIEAVMRAPR